MNVFQHRLIPTSDPHIPNPTIYATHPVAIVNGCGIEGWWNEEQYHFKKSNQMRVTLVLIQVKFAFPASTI